MSNFLKIVILGNVGSGKSTIISNLRKHVPFQIVAIDNFRKQFGEGNSETEHFARNYFYQKIQQEENQIIECSGIGKVGRKVWQILSNEQFNIFCVVVNTDPKECKSRLSNREWNTPFPIKNQENLDLFINKVSRAIELGVLQKRWRKVATLIELKNLIEEDIYENVNVILNHLLILAKDFSIDQFLMNSSIIRSYYAQNYASYQKETVQRNPLMISDQKLIIETLQKLPTSLKIIDVGAGYCQWFEYFEPKADLYLALDSNQNLLKFAPNHPKLKKIQTDIFNTNYTQTQNATIVLSFFISHFSDKTIEKLLYQFKDSSRIIIIDSHFNQAKQNKDHVLHIVDRKSNDSESIKMPKRFFRESDINYFAEFIGFASKKINVGNYWFIAELENTLFGT